MMTVLSFLLALVALIIAVVGLLLQIIPTWEGIALGLVSLSVLVIHAPIVVASRTG